MRVEPATPADLPTARAAYAHGRRLQREQGSTVWPEFDDAAILAEVAAGHLLRIASRDGTAGVFSVAYEDPAIWGELERGAHVYLHRIARAAEWHGAGLMDTVLRWARERCAALGRDGLRMDTWACNDALVAYYGRLGFLLVGRRRIAPDPRLPAHYHGIELALLERRSTRGGSGARRRNSARRGRYRRASPRGAARPAPSARGASSRQTVQAGGCMAFSFRRWRPRHLLLAWSGYWLALLLATLGEPLLRLWRMSRSPDAHGSVSAGFENSTGTLSVVVDGATAWSGSASLLAIVLWLAGPPLLLWLVWLRGFRASETDGPATLRAPLPDAAPRALGAPLPSDLDPLRPRPTPVPRDRAG